MFSKVTLYTCILLLFSLISQAQIVNIESLRSEEDSSGWNGNENLNLNYTKNTNELLELTNNLSIQYKKRRNTVLLLNSFDVSLANSQVLEQSSFYHARYNYRQNKWLIYEALAQYQRDVPLRINSRVLTGLGPRFALIDTTKQNLYIGSLMLYEYEEELGDDTIHRTVRWSSYISTFFKAKNFNFTAVLYYQPRVDKFEDYRVSLQTQLSFIILKNLAFTTSYNMAYDAFPVNDPAIPKLTIKWTNGLSYSF